MIRFFTDFADQDVLFPLALLIAACLLFAGWKRGAAAWFGTFCGVYAITTLLKLGFAACGSPPLTSPSGHTMAGTFIYGGIVLMIFREATRPAMVAACLITILIGVSRVVLGAHTIPEVVLGGFIGLSALVVLNRLAGPPPARWDRRRFVLLAPLVMVPFVHGLRSPAEGFIHMLGRRYLGPWLGCR
jgi:membrane-associated phospholipid phosphatase